MEIGIQRWSGGDLNLPQLECNDCPLPNCAILMRSVFSPLASQLPGARNIISSPQ
jgi:hypothetical protein